MERTSAPRSPSPRTQGQSFKAMLLCVADEAEHPIKFRIVVDADTTAQSIVLGAAQHLLRAHYAIDVSSSKLESLCGMYSAIGTPSLRVQFHPEDKPLSISTIMEHIDPDTKQLSDFVVTFNPVRQRPPPLVTNDNPPAAATAAAVISRSVVAASAGTETSKKDDRAAKAKAVTDQAKAELSGAVREQQRVAQSVAATISARGTRLNALGPQLDQFVADLEDSKKRRAQLKEGQASVRSNIERANSLQESIVVLERRLAMYAADAASQREHSRTMHALSPRGFATPSGPAQHPVRNGGAEESPEGPPMLSPIAQWSALAR